MSKKPATPAGARPGDSRANQKFRIPSPDKQVQALLSDPHLYEVARLISKVGFDRDSDDDRFPEDVACLIEDIKARVYGNRRQVDLANTPANYQRTRNLVRAVSGIELPGAPPTPDLVRKWRTRFAPTPKERAKMDERRTVRGLEPAPQVVREVADLLNDLGVNRSELLGQFPDGTANLAAPDPRNLLTADGTYISPFSNADVVEVNGEPVMLRSRASCPEQTIVQDEVARFTKDGRRVMGVNHVVALTRTPHGRVALGVEPAYGWEGDAALTLFEDLAGILGPRLHAICYDQGYNGWAKHMLLDHHGLVVISTAIVTKSAPEDVNQARLDAQAVLHACGVPQFKRAGKNSDLTRAVAQGRLNHDAKVREMAEHSAQGLPSGLGLPLGDSRYLSSRGNVVHVTSQFHRYDTFTHTVGGTQCPHELYVDDGALWEVDLEEHPHPKIQRPRCVQAHTVQDPDTGRWSLVSLYQLVCRVTGEVLDIDTTWKPDQLEERPAPLPRDKDGKKIKRDSAKRQPREHALIHMQPLARCDTGFGEIYGLRNDTESWFSWYKNRLLQGGRSASLHLDHQLLDLIYGCLITNALALRRYRLSN